MTFCEQLARLSACEEAREWVGDREIEAAWSECERGDWMMWLAGCVGVDRVLVVDAACDCAALAAAKVKDAAMRDAIARLIGVARQYARGEVTWVVVAKARHAMWVVYTADAAVSAVSADAAVDAVDAVSAVSAAHAADAAAVYASRVVGHPAVCSAIRARIPVEIIKAALAAKEPSNGR